MAVACHSGVEVEEDDSVSIGREGERDRRAP